MNGSNLKSSEHVWKARWCWTRKTSPRPWNQYALFRRSFALASEPRAAVVRVSADSRYILYVNGRRVHQGPARSFPGHQSFDELDLSPFLEIGVNTICAVVHQFGVPTFFSQYRDASGFLLDGEISDGQESIPVHTPDFWHCHDARAWRKDVARLSVQMGFQEHFDADVDPANWMSGDFDATVDPAWLQAVSIGPVPCHPWLSLEPRAVPLLADHVEEFQKVLTLFRGENGRGYKIATDVVHFFQSETRKKERNLLENAQAILKNSAELTTVAVQSESDFIAAVLDLETYRTGHIMLDIAEAQGDEIIDIICTEDLDKTGGPRLRGAANGPGANEEAIGFRYHCRSGAQKWETFQYVGMRYATIIFRNIDKDKPLKIKQIMLRQIHASLDLSSTFETSDTRLTEIWKVAKNTQLNCSFDALVDCPSREQAQWFGDAWIQSRVMLCAFGDLSLFRRAILQTAQSQSADGSMHSHPPSDAPAHRVPDFMLIWVVSLWEYYFHTGKTDVLKSCIPQMHRLLEFFKNRESENHLIGGFDECWVFLDWSTVRKSDYSTVLNMMYLMALRKAREICEVTGALDHATIYADRATKLAASIDVHFWDVTGNCWRDGFDPAAKSQVRDISQQANALGILLGLHPDSHQKIARDVLLKSASARWINKVITASPYIYALVIEAIAAAGLRKEAVELIREKWGEMLDMKATTFWELWDNSSSLCHGWSASPVYLLSQQILGVIPSTPGWTQIKINPLWESLEFARGIVHSPLGPIRVEWEKSTEDQLAVRVDLPEGMTAEFIISKDNHRTLTAGPHEFHT